MRDAPMLGTVTTNETDERTLARMMVGREVFMVVKKPAVKRGKPVLQVHDVSYVSEAGKVFLDRVSFNVYEAEILGIAGVEGNGQTELAEILTGLRRATHGTSLIDGKPVLAGDPRLAREAGIGQIPDAARNNAAARSASI